LAEKNRLLPTKGPVYDLDRKPMRPSQAWSFPQTLSPQPWIGDCAEQFRARLASRPQPRQQIVSNVTLQRRWEQMGGFKDPSYLERKSAATDARKAALEKFRASTAANEPGAAERQASRQAVSVARDARAAGRKAAKAAREIEVAEAAARAREAAEQAERDAAALAKRELAEKASREVAEQAGRKAGRDARYAARKARKK
jgi:hypothetical protein